MVTILKHLLHDLRWITPGTALWHWKSYIVLQCRCKQPHCSYPISTKPDIPNSFFTWQSATKLFFFLLKTVNNNWPEKICSSPPQPMDFRVSFLTTLPIALPVECNHLSFSNTTEDFCVKVFHKSMCIVGNLMIYSCAIAWKNRKPMLLNRCVFFSPSLSLLGWIYRLLGVHSCNKFGYTRQNWPKIEMVFQAIRCWWKRMHWQKRTIKHIQGKQVMTNSKSIWYSALPLKQWFIMCCKWIVSTLSHVLWL